MPTFPLICQTKFAREIQKYFLRFFTLVCIYNISTYVTRVHQNGSRGRLSFACLLASYSMPFAIYMLNMASPSDRLTIKVVLLLSGSVVNPKVVGIVSVSFAISCSAVVSVVVLVLGRTVVRTDNNCSSVRP